MIRPAFIAWLAVWSRFSSEEVERFGGLANDRGLIAHLLSERILLAVSPDAAEVSEGGALVGDIFAKGSARRLSADERQQIVGRGPQMKQLTEGYWGSYIAVAADPRGERVEVLRAPFGDLPCYWSNLGERIVLGSSIPLLVAFGVAPPAIDWRQVAFYLLATELRSGSTCLSEIGELASGQLLSVANGAVAARAGWCPWRFTGAQDRAPTAGEAAAIVRQAVLTAVAGRASGVGRSVLLLSGGVDSSVVAASLAQAGQHFDCVNMVTRDASGDERDHARAVAEFVGAPLVERIREVDDVELGVSNGAQLPRPSARLFRQPTERAARAQAKTSGAAVVFGGGGGDNLFCSLQSVAPAADRLKAEGLSSGFLRTARDIALHADVSLWTVARRALVRNWTRSARYRWPIDSSLLSRDAQALSGEAVRHPWLLPPAGTAHGRAAHVALVLAAASLAEPAESEATIPLISPLVAQPVVEAVLRVPSWLWFSNGLNRAAARDAFAGRLPAHILGRRSKGTPGSFMAEIVEARRGELSELLLDGLLARQHLLDRPALEALLRPDVPVRDLSFARILQLADAEAWARSWR